MSSNVSFDSGNNQMVRSSIKQIGGDESSTKKGGNSLKKVPSADPFEFAPDSSKKGFQMNAVKELAEDEDSLNEGVLKNLNMGQADGDWDNMSDLGSIDGNFKKDDGLLGSLGGAKKISFKNIDDDFEIEPDLNKKGGFANNRDNMRQGVSSGFNFKEILSGTNPDDYSEEDDFDRDSNNPLEEDQPIPDFVLNSELQDYWSDGRGKAVLIDNIEELVEQLVMREAEALIEQNEHKVRDSMPAPIASSSMASSGKKKMAKF